MTESKEMYVYILDCEDGSLYTGLTDDVERRFKEHVTGQGSLYTKCSRPLKVVYIENFCNFVDAQKREKQIKDWTHRKKLALISGDMELLNKL